MHLEVLERGVRLRLRCMFGDIQLVVDVAVQRVALGLDGGDRLAGELERDRHVPQELPADGVGDDRALVADDRVVDPGRLSVRPHRPEHPAGDQDHVDARRRARRRLPRGCAAGAPRPSDQRAVEVAGERLDARAGSRPGGSAACDRRDVGGDVGDLLRRQLAAERRHHALAVRHAVDDESRPAASPRRGSGRPLPVAPASFSVWQLLQPAVSKTCLPAVGVARDLGRRRDLADHRLRRRRRDRSGAAAGERSAQGEEDQGSAEHARESTHCRRSAQRGPPAPRTRFAGSARTSARRGRAARSRAGSSRRDPASRSPPRAASSATSAPPGGSSRPGGRQ